MDKKVKIWTVEITDLVGESLARIVYQGGSEEEAFKHVLDQIDEEVNVCMTRIYQNDTLYNKNTMPKTPATIVI